jgi:hypothetical protein
MAGFTCRPTILLAAGVLVGLVSACCPLPWPLLRRFRLLCQEDNSVGWDLLLSPGCDSKIADDGGEIAVNGFEILDERGEIAVTGGQIAGEGTEIADEGTEIADQGTEVAEDGAEIAGKGTEIADEDTEIADQGTEVAEDGADIADEVTEVAEDGAEITDEGLLVAAAEIARDGGEVTALAGKRAWRGGQHWSSLATLSRMATILILTCRTILRPTEKASVRHLRMCVQYGWHK